ncbi:MAG: hypothetical protein WBQ20_12015, partial [Methyloceanibacter sp.]
KSREETPKEGSGTTGGSCRVATICHCDAQNARFKSPVRDFCGTLMQINHKIPRKRPDLRGHEALKPTDLGLNKKGKTL